jgi:hypothetical protein
MSLPPHTTRGGVTLRHWTTDSSSFVGGRQRPSPALPYGEAAEGRRLDLVASRLRLVKAQLTAGIEVANETPSS